MKAKKRTLPTALATRAKALADAKHKRCRARALELITLIERRKQRITEDFYDIGEALKELRAPELYTALDYKTFEQLLKAKVNISLVTAQKLIKTVEQVPRELALSVGQAKAAALIDLASATPEDDTPSSLATAKLRVRGRHQAVDLATASGNTIRKLASEVRREHAPVGTALHAAERVAKEIADALGKARVVGADVRAVRLRRKGKIEAYQLEIRVPIEARKILGAVLRK